MEYLLDVNLMFIWALSAVFEGCRLLCSGGQSTVSILVATEHTECLSQELRVSLSSAEGGDNHQLVDSLYFDQESL